MNNNMSVKKSLPRLMGRVLMEPWALMDDKMGMVSEMLLRHVRGEVDLTEGALMGEVDGGDDDDSYVLCGRVAVVSVAGMLGKRLSSLEVFCGGCDVDRIRRDVMLAMGDDRVEAIVIDVDSPGGMVTGTQELADFIAEASEEKPVLAYTEMMMCSAAYWIGSAAGEVFCSESSLVGSIGVVCSAVDHSERWKEEGLEALVFRSAELKAVGHVGEKWKDEWKASMQSSVDATAQKFFAHVRNARGGDLDDECFSGDYWSGEKLLELGLVDGFADTLDDFVSIVNLRLEEDLG